MIGGAERMCRGRVYCRKEIQRAFVPTCDRKGCVYDLVYDAIEKLLVKLGAQDSDAREKRDDCRPEQLVD
jgi:hypothetical protein